MMRKIITLTAALLAAVLMTACGKSYDFSQRELTEAMGVKRDVFDEMETQPDDNGDIDNELMEQAMAMTGSDFYTYWLAQGNSETDYDIVEINFSGGKVSTVTVSSVTFEDLTIIPSEYTVLGIRAGDTIDDAEAKAEAYFGEEGKALSDDKEMWVLTDGVHDYISYGDFSGKKGYLQITVNRDENVVMKVEYSKY